MSDRLLTFSKPYRSSSEFDNFTAKTVTAHLGHSVFSITYAGVAFLGGVPTDQLIAETLIGGALTKGPAPILAPTSPTIARRSANDAAEAICRNLIVAMNGETSRVRSNSLEVVLCGFHRIRKGRWRPFLWCLTWSERERRFLQDRHNEDPPMDRVHHSGLRLLASAGARSKETTDRLLPKLQGASSPDSDMKALVEEIREISKSNSTVGRDVQLVVIGPKEAFAEGQKPSSDYVLGTDYDHDPEGPLQGFVFRPWYISNHTWQGPRFEKAEGIELQSLHRQQRFVNNKPVASEVATLFEEAQFFGSIVRPRLPRS
ncbi:MAG: hypothetical protein R2761_00595 [Acidimicrobiales bacterium]